jgi:hypothetical protein
MSQETTVSGGIGFTGLLTIAFTILKLTGNISWSWWWVVSPLWIPLAFYAVVFLVTLLLAFLFAMVGK